LPTCPATCQTMEPLQEVTTTCNFLEIFNFNTKIPKINSKIKIMEITLYQSVSKEYGGNLKAK